MGKRAGKPVFWSLGSLFVGAVLLFFYMLAGPQAQAQERTIKIGFVSTFSGGGAALGIDVRDGFNLALKLRNNRLGGLLVQVLFADDEQNPSLAQQAVDRMLRRDKVDFMTGIIFSNVLLAVGESIFREKVFYISPNAGPSEYAGEQCNFYFLNVAWQNDNLHEAMGQYAQNKGFENVFLIAPNYPAGRDALTGFKRFYRGRISGEVYHRLNQLDFSAEIAQIRATRPSAVYAFEPGAMGINFIKQYNESGLMKEIPLLLPGFSADADVIRAVGRALVGVYNSSHWALDLNNPVNRTFVEEFRKAYGRIPTLYAAQGYDTALLLDTAIRAVKGDISNQQNLRRAMLAGFNSTRGYIRFSPNGYPIQNYYLRQVVETPQGEIVNRLVDTIFTGHRDAYFEKCNLR